MKLGPCLVTALGVGAVLLFPGCDDPVEDSAVEVVYACPDKPNCTQEFCEQILIPGGQFTMGTDHEPHEDAYWPSGDERPAHVVALEPYCIDKYEVTLGRYEACVDEKKCSRYGLMYEFPSITTTVVNHYPEWCYDDIDQCLEHAVNAKSYWQAQDYCEWQGGRLCTEAEWERAANGPGLEQRLHPWGDEDPTSELTNLPSTGTGYVERVDICEAGASPEGVMNLSGNVYEWVEDRYQVYDAPTDGSVHTNHGTPAAEGDDGVGRGSCFFTEPEHTVSERSVFPLDFDWG